MSGTHSLSGAMQDGRAFTNYIPSSMLNTSIANSNNIPTWNSTQYREYLQTYGLNAIRSAQSACGPYQCSDYGMAVPDGTSPSPPYDTVTPEIQ